MKDKILSKIGLFSFLAMILSMMVMYKSCDNYRYKYLNIESKYNNLFHKYDSILALPPDTIILSPEIIKGDTIYISHNFENQNKPEFKPKIYEDSLINDSIDVHLKIKAHLLYSVDYSYKPIFKYQEKIIERNIPYPIEVEKPVEIFKGGLFFNVGIGYGDDFSGKIGLMYLSKKQNTYGYDIIKVGKENIHMISYGIRF